MMATYEESLARLNDAQRKAVLTTEGPVLVIAGPGTGKTQLLTTRIAHILATTDTLPQNILCLTFTESGALTMRERLSSMIGKAAHSVTISTYHAFGSELIRRYPDYFAGDPALKPIDDLGIDSIFREIIDTLPFTNPLKYADSYLRDVKSFISDAKRALLSPEVLRETANKNIAFIEAASPLVSTTLGDIIRISKKDTAAFALLAEKLSSLEIATTDGDSTLSLSRLFQEELREALDSVNILGKQTPLTKWKNQWLARDSAGHFVVDGQKMNEKMLAIADVYEQYLLQLKQRGLFDYEDMILRAVHALETNGELRYSLQEQYLYILLDEFQDTNGAQLRLVKLLTDSPVHEGRPNILAVGDDDQAIYAFQGADYSHMLQFNRMYRDVLLVPLTKNYRSTAGILSTASAVSAQIEERLHNYFPGIEKTLDAEKQSHAKSIIERRQAQSDLMQFAWVARRIRELLDSGTPPNEIAVLAPQHRYLAPLLPYLAKLDIPVRYDKRENVLDDPAITQLLRMAELCIALQDTNTSSSDALWTEVLSFDFWQLSTSTIWQLSWQARDSNHSWTEELLADEQLKPIALFFIRLSQLAQAETLETIFDYLIGSQSLDLNEPGLTTYACPYYRYNFGNSSRDTGQLSIFTELGEATTSPEFWNLLSNLIVLRARLHDYRQDVKGPLTISDFISFVDAHRAAEIQILNTSPYASGNEAVQLMTAFKAKGMEFEAVFLLAVNDEAWSAKARGAGNRIALPANLQFMRYAGATHDERLRLFYVALTRAKSQLYLVGYDKEFSGKSTSHLQYLDESVDEKNVWLSPLLPSGNQYVLPVEDTDNISVDPTDELSAYWQQRHEKALDSSSLRHLLHERLAHFQLSPTHINDFTDVMYCGPRAFFLRTILRFPTAPKPEVQFGNAMHETLEWLHIIVRKDGLLPCTQALEKAYEKRLSDKRMSKRYYTHYLERGLAALQAYVAQRAQTIAADNIVEYNFRNEGVFIGKAHLTGKIDKMIVDRKQKTITIIDYKTGRKSYTTWKREAKLHKYKLQLYIYRALIEGSHTYAGYKVTDAFLEFVEPDETGAIQQLHLIFDDNEYARIKHLVKVVWERIQLIDLPDISSYSPDLNGILAFEKYLLDE